MGDTLYIIDGHSQIYRAYYAPFRDLTSPTGEPTRATHVFCQLLMNFITKRRPKYLAMAVDGPAEKLLRRRVYADYKITRKPMPEDLLPQIHRIYQIVEAMGIPVLKLEGYEADDILATAAAKFASPDMQVVLISRDKDLDQLVTPNVLLYDPTKDQTLDAAAILQEKGYTPDKAVEIQTLMGDASDNVPGIPGIGPKTAAKLIAQYGSADAVLAHADEQTPKLRQALLDNAAILPLARQLVTLDRNAPIDLNLPAMQFRGLPRDPVRRLFVELGLSRLIEQLDRFDASLLRDGASAPPAPAIKPAPPAPAKPAASAPAPTVKPSSAGFQGSLFGTMMSAPAPAAETAAPTPTEQPQEHSPAEPAMHMESAADCHYRCIDTVEALEQLGAELAGVTRLAVDTETTGVNPMWAEMVGMSLAWKPKAAAYIPVKGPLGSTVLDLAHVRRVLGPILASEKVQKIGHNLKYDYIILANAGLPIRGPMFDTMIAAHVLDSTRPSFKLDSLAAEFLNRRCIPIADLIGRGKNQITMDAVPIDVVTPYASEDADLSFRLADILEQKLAAEKLTDLLQKLEMPLMPVLAEMERTGIAVDVQVLRQMETELGKNADDLRDRIIAAAGGLFNPDSPKQLAAVLFEKLKLPIVKRTKSGPSTDSDVLEELSAMHELPAMVLDYRKLQKLLGTYLKALAECILPRTGRVHTSFHQAATVTGRLSSSDPNLQNIPIRTEIGKRIRAAFVAEPGNLLLSADYSQVELRVLAHLCQDPTMIAAFHNDQDIHRIVAAEVFGVPLSQVTPEQRAKAKTVNFGIVYGQTAFGLAATLRIGRGEAGEFIRAYKQRFPQIEEFLQACVEKAKADGYVETIFGRRRRVQGLDASNASVRAGGERLAINSTVQGSAADLIKQAMVNIDARLKRENRPGRMLLQIHDELLFEVPAEHGESLRQMVLEEMSGAIKLRVPLKVDAGLGGSWMDAK